MEKGIIDLEEVPFIQYTHARISSLVAAATSSIDDVKELTELTTDGMELENSERDLIQTLLRYPEKVEEAARSMSPPVIANYTYDLVRSYNSLYNELPVIREKDTVKRDLRIRLSEFTAIVLRSSCDLLGMNVPNRM